MCSPQFNSTASSLPQHQAARCWLLVCPICCSSAAASNTSQNRDCHQVSSCFAGDCDAGCAMMLLLTGSLICCLSSVFLAAWLLGRCGWRDLQAPAGRRALMQGSKGDRLSPSSTLSASLSGCPGGTANQRRPSYGYYSYGSLDEQHTQMESSLTSSPVTSLSMRSSASSSLLTSVSVPADCARSGVL